jgi:RimJ/RimL family protein N-acetyltransferase
MPPLLRGARVTLRPPTERDIEFSLAFANDEDLRGWLRFWRPTGEEEERAWLRDAAQSEEPTWLIEEGSRPVGFASLTSWNKPAGVAEMGLGLLATGDRGRGVGEEACRLVLRHAFDAMGLQRVYLHVLDDNAPAIRLYERLGFRREGVLRRHAYKRGALRDQLVMGLLREEAAP